jgi:hypothetical protein
MSGKLDPLNSKLLYITSAHRGVGQSNTDFAINFGNADRIQRVKHIALKSITVANLFGNITQYNNLVFFKIDSNTIVTASVPPRQYTASQLSSALVGAVGPLTALSFSADSRFQFTCSAPIQILASSPMAKLLGIVKDTAFDTSFTADHQPNMSGVSKVFVHASFAENNMIRSDGRSSSVFEVCDMEGIAYGQVSHLESNSLALTHIAYDSPVNFHNVRISLRDEEGRVLELPQNFDFSMVLRIYTK